MENLLLLFKNNKLQLFGEGSKKILPRTFFFKKKHLICDFISPERGRSEQILELLLLHSGGNCSSPESPSPKNDIFNVKISTRVTTKVGRNIKPTWFFKKFNIKLLPFSQETKPVPESALQSFYYFFYFDFKGFSNMFRQKKKGQLITLLSGLSAYEADFGVVFLLLGHKFSAGSSGVIRAH